VVNWLLRNIPQNEDPHENLSL